MNIYSTLNEVTQKLDILKLPYMLSGSVAMGFYAAVRTTFDIDIVIELYQKDVPVFVNTFLGFYVFEEGIHEEIKRRGMFNIIDNNTGVKIDFILRKNSEYDKIAFSRRRQMDDFYTDIYVISPEDLIIAKLKWIQEMYSDRQISDIKQLLSSTNLEIDYMMNWITELKLKTFNLPLS
jgi:hypothetical protein